MKNITREYMAAEMGMSVSGYARIERGEVGLSFARVKRIAAILDADVSTLLEFDAGQLFRTGENTMAGKTSKAGSDYREKYIQMLEAEIERLRIQLNNISES